LLGSGFQRRTFLFLWVAELSLASVTSFPQQQITTSEPQQLSNKRVLLITPRHGPRHKHRFSVAAKLLLSDCMTYSIVACAAIGRDWAETIIPLLLFTRRCLVTAGCCDCTVLGLGEYVTIWSGLRRRPLYSPSCPLGPHILSSLLSDTLPLKRTKEQVKYKWIRDHYLFSLYLLFWKK
jgi:hypothetical protein